MRFSIVGRALAIGAVAAAILLPIALIGGKISERQARAAGVVAQFASETSGPQLIVGPLLALTCEETFTEERQVMRGGKAETLAETRTRACPTAYFPPRTFNAAASMPVETLHRGIYSIRLFRADVELAGGFVWPQPPGFPAGVTRVWKQAYVTSFVQDPRGIKSITSSLSSAVSAGVGEGELAQFALREPLGPYESRAAGTPIPFAYKMRLVGTSSLRIAPVGDRNEIVLASDWRHPSFSEAWSPDERSITPEGFRATWHITSVATAGQASWSALASKGNVGGAAGAGVSLFDPVNIYALSYRATEYAFLFVLLTFAALALAEVAAGVRLHPMQYALVGSALAVFFLLLLALSEHLDFARAYAISAAACVSLLTYYLRHPLGSLLRSSVFFAMFVALYGALYVLLRSEDHAMLLGSVMVFTVLAIVMVATRKIDWARFPAMAQPKAAP
jgi:inner membrane protein